MAALLEVRGLKKRFGGLQAVAGVDLRVEAGERRAVIGPNGAGKTTLFNLITGHYRPDEGAVTFDGNDITGRATHQVSRAGIGRAFQITSIFPGLSVHENVQLGIIARLRESRRVTGRAAGRHAEEVTAILQDVGLASLATERAGNLSHGDQRALELAISVALEPKLLLLDEPTAGMAPGETTRTMDLVRRIADERQLTVLFCEHDMDVVFGTAHRILVMHQGGVLVDGTPEEVRDHPEVRRVYLGAEDDR
ncbi:ABC transporter ATP-binding protein [Nitriliruptor alkaliphilus]|uniref:ABC transporter ATP-binding protein n=1 Tax=Nitriliruptor alkaliphilus TaxID=427918 RepID=UPI000697E3B4|nr:ABC transporter ATP-binding protein [Nitriliruptor alkaliphilus]